MEKPKIVVCGATGNQGGSAATALLKSGRYIVTALTRNPASAPALALADMGAEVLRADLQDMNSLLSAFSGAYGVFGVTQPWNYALGLFDTAAESRQAKNIIWACKEAGVQEVVFSTVLNVNNNISGVSWIDSKRDIEELFDRFLPNGVLMRPALYMQNIGSEIMRLDGSVLKGRFDGDSKVPYVDLQDIGDNVARIFDKPERYRGKILNLAGEIVSGNEIAALLSIVSEGRVFSYSGAAELYLRLFRPRYLRMRRFFELQGRLLANELPQEDKALYFFSARIRDYLQKMSVS